MEVIQAKVDTVDTQVNLDTLATQEQLDFRNNHMEDTHHKAVGTHRKEAVAAMVAMHQPVR